MGLGRPICRWCRSSRGQYGVGPSHIGQSYSQWLSSTRHGQVLTSHGRSVHPPLTEGLPGLALRRNSAGGAPVFVGGHVLAHDPQEVVCPHVAEEAESLAQVCDRLLEATMRSQVGPEAAVLLLQLDHLLRVADDGVKQACGGFGSPGGQTQARRGRPAIGRRRPPRRTPGTPL